MVYNKSSKRTCITCTAKGVNKDEISLSSKKNGLYSMLPKILNCGDKYNPSINELEEETPEIIGTKLDVSLEIKETNRWLFYWAAEAGSSIAADKPEDAATSYGDERNHGVTKSDKEGNATLVLNCPKLYKENGTLYPRHVHYTVLTTDDVWSTRIGTVEVMCKVPYDIMKEIVKKRSYLVMNALSKEAYDKQHIPHSILFHHESLDGLTKQKKDGIIKQLIKEHLADFPDIKEFIDSSKSIKDVPIITYCAHDECESSSKLTEHLYSCGYYNVMEYPGGTREWFSETKDIDLFEDIPSEEEVEDDDYLDEDTKISEDEEILVYEGIEYIHKLDTDEILSREDMEVIGTYDGEDIEWNSSKEYQKHMKRIRDTGGKPFTDDGEGGDKDEDNDEEEDKDEEDEDKEDGDEDKEDEDKEDEDKEDKDEDEDKEDEDKEDEDENNKNIQSHMSSDSEEDSDDDIYGSGEYNEEMLRSKKVSELKELLDKLKEKSVTGKKEDMINCLVKCKPVFKGGGRGDNVMYGGGINQSTFNQQYRGWGFTFLR